MVLYEILQESATALGFAAFGAAGAAALGPEAQRRLESCICMARYRIYDLVESVTYCDLCSNLSDRITRSL